MIETFVKRPITTMMFVLFFVLLGMVSITGMRVEENPQIDLPIVSIQIIYPGASPDEIENEILKKVEDSVAEISEIKNITGKAYENFGYVIIEFNLDVDSNIKTLEVKDKVERLQNEFPSVVEKPIISKIDIGAASIMDLSLKSDRHSDGELYAFANDYLKTQLTTIKGISSIDIIGGEERQINVKLDAELMKQNYITISDVISKLSAYNISVSGGDIKHSEQAVGIRFFGEIKSVEDLRKMHFTTKEGNDFTLGNIAVVEDSVKEQETAAYLNQDKVVFLSLKKVMDGNAVEISAGLKKMMPKLQKLMPEGMTLSVVNDSTEYILDETESTFYNILLGMFLTVIVILLFTANIRITAIAIVIIPVSLIATFFVMQQSNFTINSMTLMAIASVLGTLIANALIIVESALTHLDKGEDPETAAINGTKEVVGAVIASSGTNMAVFIPLGMMAGIIGLFMRQFGLTVVYATVLSIIMSFSLTPMMTARLLKASKDIKKPGKLAAFATNMNKHIVSSYKKLFGFITTYKKTALALNLTVVFMLFSVAKYIGSEFIPSSDTNKLVISMKTPEGSTIEKTSRKSLEIVAIVEKYPEIKNVVSKLGQNGVVNSEILLNLTPLDNGRVSDLVIIDRVIRDLSSISDIEIDVKRADKNDADITINVYGDDYVKIAEYATVIVDKMKSSGAFNSVSSTNREPKKERRLVPVQETMDFFGISNAQVAGAIRASLYGDTTNQFKEAGKTYDINITLADDIKNNDLVFDDILVSSPKGLIPVSKLGKLTEIDSVSSLSRHNRQKIIEISGYLGAGVLSQIEDQLTKELDGIEFAAGYGYNFGGDSDMANETAAELGKAMLLAIIFTYMLLAAIMNSLLHPFTISLAIITAFSGVFLALFLAGGTLNLASMLSLVMLIGLAVNNEILVVDRAIVGMREENKTPLAAIWTGYEEKLRTIFMTSIAIIFATIPQMFSADSVKSSMGTVLVGGMVTSLVFSLTLTPILFIYIENAKMWFENKVKKQDKKPLYK